jgi:hypothetical protein
MCQNSTAETTSSSYLRLPIELSCRPEAGALRFGGHRWVIDLPTLRLVAIRRRTDGAGGFFLMSIRWSFSRSPSSKEPTHHVRWDVPRAVPVKPMLGHELNLSIGGRVQEAGGFNHDHAGSVAIGVAIGQPEEGRGLSVARRAGVACIAPSCGQHAQGRHPPRPVIPSQRFALPRQMM